MLTFALDHKDIRTHVDDTASRLDYFCPVCGAQVIPKKGRERRHHFAHKGDHACTDTWGCAYEDSEWHMGWQVRFPRENREITLALGSVKHRADILTARTVVEFQRSSLSPDQFDERSSFYLDLGYRVVWLFDLRDLYESGAIVDSSAGQGAGFTWDNPRKAFRSHDIACGNVDVFFQLTDDEGRCIVRPVATSAYGFESFAAGGWMSADDFLALIGLKGGSCDPPDMVPLETDEAYRRFKERYELALDPQQERAAQAVDGATLLLAVPGSGKTTVLVSRLGYLALERGADPESLVCLTYTRAAAKEMRDRFAKRFAAPEVAGRITFCTINKLAKNIYEEWCRRHDVRPMRIDDKAARRLLREACRRVRGSYVSEADAIDVESAISYVKNMMLLDDAGAIGQIADEIDGFDEILALYQKGMSDAGLMDFDDQALFAFDALASDRELRASYRDRYRYWSVDEAQDSSKIQHNLVYRLAGRGGNVFMVGDEDQSIYGYRGAYPRAMLNFKYAYPNALVLTMESNYRSCRRIVSAASRFIGRNKGRFDKGMRATRTGDGVVRMVEVRERSDQWQAALDLIRHRKSELAVLYRDNDVAIPLVDRLLAEGVPFAMSQGKRTFFDSVVVRDAFDFLALAADPWDKEAFMRVYHKAQCYIRKRDAEWAKRRSHKGGPDVLEALKEQVSTYGRRKDVPNALRFARLVRSLGEVGPMDAISRLKEGGYGSYLRENGKGTVKLDILCDLASREMTADGLKARIKRLGEFYASPHSLRGGACGVTLSSIHSAKGLEFGTVVIMDAVDGTFPSSRPNPLDRSKDSAAANQEERRLFYVAMTRARDELALVRPTREGTSFLDEVLPRKRRASDGHDGASRAVRHASGSAKVPTPAPRERMPRATAKPTDPRYDVDRWEVMARPSACCRVATNGDMDAVVDVRQRRRCVEMTIDLDADIMAEVVEHIADLAYGADHFSLCLSATTQQRAGTTRAAWHSDGCVDVALLSPSAAACIALARRLVERGVPLTMTVYDGHGNVIGRRVKNVDPRGLAFRLGNEDLGVY